MPRLVGINHIALEVGDIDEALAWYGRFFELELRGRGPRMAFIDIGDQFIALSAGREQRTTRRATSDSSSTTRRRPHGAAEGGVSVAPSGSLDFLDPWGNNVQVVDYREIQFTKAPAVLRGMGLEGLEKSASAIEELRGKGLAGG